MGDMGDVFNAMRANNKIARDAKANQYEPALIKAGAILITDGVYRLGDFDCYPRRGYARNYRLNKKTCIEFVLKYNGDSDLFPAPKRKIIKGL